ncbi:MAG: phage portal protein [Polaromonas sp.]
MGFLSRAVAEKKSGGVYERWLDLLNVGNKSQAGPSVDLNAAFRQSAALACMRAIAQGCAQVPFKLLQDYEQDGLSRKRVARDHSMYDVMTVKPNNWQTSFDLRETLVMHACMGNAYVYKNMYRGKVAELILLNPASVRAEQKEDWSTVYRVRGKSGQEVEIPSSLIWHVRGPSWDGFLGLDMLNMIRETLGLAIAVEQSQASLHANGVRPSGIYSVDGTLNKDQQQLLVAWLKKEAGAANTGTPMVLDRNAKWLSTAMTGIDAETLATRQAQIEEVARFFGVLPIVIGYTGDKANTYASAEAMFAAHRILCLAPWYTRIQESADVNLLTAEERQKGFYWKFMANGLMQASAKDRAEFYAKALGSGGSPAFMTQDEIRGLEDLDPMGGEAAKLPPRVAAGAPATPPANAP